MNRLDAQLSRVNCIFLLGFDSQLLTQCNYRLQKLLFLFLFVVMRGGRLRLNVQPHYKMRVSGCEAQLKSEAKPLSQIISNETRNYHQHHGCVWLQKRSWIKWFCLCLQSCGLFSFSFSPLTSGLDSQLINLQILFSIKCLQKDNCDFINSFLGSRWCSAGLPCWISDDAVVLCTLYCGNP